MLYLYLKALHLVSLVSWFAGLFYLVRLFIYHTERRESAELAAQFAVMERRLWYGITVPAMLATVGFGVWLMIVAGAWRNGWFHVKLLLIGALLGYHFYSGRIRKQLVRAQYQFTSRQLRVWNEVATFLLIAIVFIAVVKAPVAAAWGVGGFALLTVVILLLLQKE